MSLTEFTVHPGKAADDEARDAFVRAHPRGTFFHLSGWRRAVERVMGHKGRDLLAGNGDELMGVLPLMSCRGLGGGSNLISMPYAVYGGALGRDEHTERMLFETAEQLALRERVGRLELRCREDPGLDLPASTLHATFIRDLPADPEEVLTRMPKKARAAARKARDRHGLTHAEGLQYLPDLVRLFHRNKRALGSPALPAAFFQALVDEHPGQVSVHAILKGSDPVALVMGFHYGKEFLAYYSGTAEGADREVSASNFMYMAVQQWATQQGFTRFDFGRSRKDSGPFSFKVHQGFEAADLHYRFRLVRNRDLPSLNPSNPKMHILQATWRRLPPGLARWLSGPLSRYLP